MAETYSSVSRVFAIPELTESILLHTYALCTTATGASEHEPRSISWKNDINDLKAESNGMRWLLCTANRVNRFWNSIISTSAPIQERLFLQWHSRQNRTLKYNPLMASKFTWGYIGRYKVFPCGEEKFLQALLYRDASWRRMFPVVPPVRRVEVHQEIRPGRFADNERKNGRIALDDLPEKDGLRMGMLFDIAEEWKKPLNASLFHVKWVGDVDIEKIRMEEGQDMREMQANLPEVSGNTTMTTGGSSALIPGETVVGCVKVELEDSSAEVGVWDDEIGRFSRGHLVSYPKMESEGKRWSLDDIEWDE